MVAHAISQVCRTLTTGIAYYTFYERCAVHAGLNESLTTRSMIR